MFLSFSPSLTYQFRNSCPARQAGPRRMSKRLDLCIFCIIFIHFPSLYPNFVLCISVVCSQSICFIEIFNSLRKSPFWFVVTSLHVNVQRSTLELAMDQKPSVPLPLPVRRKPISRLASLGVPGKRLAPAHAALSSRRASVTGLTPGNKAQRTSKTTHKLVLLPSAPQTKPHVVNEDDDLTLGPETDGGIREHKSTPERMTKVQRKLAGYKRITAYCVAESFRMRLLSTFLKREHNVSPRIFDEAQYAVSSIVICCRNKLDFFGSTDVSSPTTTRLWSKHPRPVFCTAEKEERNFNARTSFRSRGKRIRRHLLHI